MINPRGQRDDCAMSMHGPGIRFFSDFSQSFITIRLVMDPNRTQVFPVRSKGNSFSPAGSGGPLIETIGGNEDQRGNFTIPE